MKKEIIVLSLIIVAIVSFIYRDSIIHVFVNKTVVVWSNTLHLHDSSDIAFTATITNPAGLSSTWERIIPEKNEEAGAPVVSGGRISNPPVNVGADLWAFSEPGAPVIGPNSISFKPRPEVRITMNGVSIPQDANLIETRDTVIVKGRAMLAYKIFYVEESYIKTAIGKYIDLIICSFLVLMLAVLLTFSKSSSWIGFIDIP